MTEALTIEEIARILDAEVHTEGADLSRKVSTACASDLMSDVLAFSKPRSILLSGLNTPQTIRTAEVADLLAVCLAFGKTPDVKMIELAEESNIPLMTTASSLYSASGRLYVNGLHGSVETQ